MGPMVSSIQLLRGVAVTAVVLYHLGISSFGFLGVDMFFFISGFVITLSLANSLNSGKFSYRTFLRKRALRLLPALGFTIGITIALASYFQNVLGLTITRDMGIAALFGLSNIQAHLVTNDYFATQALGNGLLHTWSLSLEWQFYLFFPAVFIFAMKLRSKFLSPKFVLGIISIISLALFATSFLFQDIPVFGGLFGYYSPVTRAWQFVFGAFLALSYLNRGDSSAGYWRNSHAEWAIISFLVALFFFPASIPPQLLSFLVILGAGFAIYNSREPLSNEFDWRSPLMFVGDRSYSIYLIHWPLIVFAETLPVPKIISVATVVALSLAAANYSYRWLEMPFMSSKVNLPFRNQKLYGAAISGTVLAFGLTLGSTVINVSDSYLKDAHATYTPYALGCADGSQVCVDEKVHSVDTAAESLGGEGAIVLLGDSNAAQYYEGLADSAVSLGKPLMSFTKGGCPTFAIFPTSSHCQKYIDEAGEIMADIAPSVVIVAFSDSYWTREAEIVRNKPLRREVIAQNLVQHLEQLEKFGHNVVLVEQIPIADYFSPELISKWDEGPISRDVSDSREKAAEFKLAVSEQLKRVVLTSTTFWVQPWKDICDRTTCVIYDGTRLSYRDLYHLSVAFSDSLGPYWAIQVEEHLR